MVQKSNVLLGIALLCLGLFIVPINDALAKYLSDEIGILEIIWARFFGHFIILVPLVYCLRGKASFFNSNTKHQVARGLFIFLGTAFFYIAITNIPLANALSLLLVAPIIVVILSVYLLGEKITYLKILCALIGFIGTILVIQPGFSSFNLYSAYAFISGLFYAMYLIYTRKVNFASDSLITLSYSTIPGAVIMTILLPLYWSSIPDLNQIVLLSCIGPVVIVSHFFFIKAYQFAEASVLAPIHYFEIVSNALISILFFKDIPSILVAFGILCIISSGVLISLNQK
tara:strand:+ start:1051 stop:1908 length:858 start_codon:yes stop_codon:yes gene_type:complete